MPEKTKLNFTAKDFALKSVMSLGLQKRLLNFNKKDFPEEIRLFKIENVLGSFASDSFVISVGVGKFFQNVIVVKETLYMEQINLFHLVSLCTNPLAE